MQPCISNSFRIAGPPCKGCSLLLAYGMAGVLPTEGDAHDPGAGIDRHTDTQDVYKRQDLLSLAMARAPADCAWVTVMGNMNTVAVATLRCV